MPAVKEIQNPVVRLTELVATTTHVPVWLAALRRNALARFSQTGFPTTDDEDWRFTPVTALKALPFVIATPDFDRADAAIQHSPFASIEGPRLVFVDGQFSRELSQVTNLPDGVRVQPISEALRQDNSALQSHIERLPDRNASPFLPLNTALFSDGAHIEIPAGCELPAPVRVLFLTTSPHAGAFAALRNVIVAGANSRVTIIEQYVDASGAAYWNNVQTTLVAGEGAIVEHIRFQEEGRHAFHTGSLHLVLARDCRVKHHSFALGARLSRQDIRARLDGEGLDCVLNGLYLTDGDRLADHHMVVEHLRPHCTSHEYFNGLLDDRSRGVFHGRIHVHPGADKTDAKQTNKNILLSKDATVDTKPQLEIYADDVRCTHGATIGQIDAASVFYLRARGLGEEDARRMLLHAFAGEIVERIDCAPAREEIDSLIWERLERNPHIAATA